MKKFKAYNSPKAKKCSHKKVSVKQPLSSILKARNISSPELNTEEDIMARECLKCGALLITRNPSIIIDEPSNIEETKE